LSIKKIKHKQVSLLSKLYFEQKNKFMDANVEYYVEYAQAVRELDEKKLKYCDESHFASRGNHSLVIATDVRQLRGWSKKGEPLEMISDVSIAESYTVTLVLFSLPLSAISIRSHGSFHQVTSNVGAPIYVSRPRAGSNTSFDFLAFVIELIRAKFLSAGDIFVLDNSSIHYAEDIQQVLDDVLEANGITMIFLPTYSPELNPCELVFAQVKYWLRR